jgi:hypothetical protein
MYVVYLVKEKLTCELTIFDYPNTSFMISIVISGSPIKRITKNIIKNLRDEHISIPLDLPFIFSVECSKTVREVISSFMKDKLEDAEGKDILYLYTI